MKPVLAIQHAWEDPLGYLGDVLDSHRIPYSVVSVETEPVPDPTHYAAIIALGGPQHVYDYEHYPYLQQEKAMIRQAVEEDIPFLGICLGGQLLADVFGGQVRQHSMTEIGFYDIEFTAEGKHDPLYTGLPGYQKVFHWHEDTFELPEGALRLATSGNTKNQAFRYGHRAYGLQYHIEHDAAMLDTWLYYPAFKESMLAVLGIEAYTHLEEQRPTLFPLYQEHTRIMFENFLHISKLI